MTGGPSARTDRLRSALVLLGLLGLALLCAGIMSHEVRAITIGVLLLVITAAFAAIMHEGKLI